MISITLQPLPVMTGSQDQEGRLVLADGQLVAVLVRLADEVHGAERGGWFLEVGFGPCDGPEHPVFESLDEAQVWVRRRIER
jgi:hypothetical protein